MVPCSHLGLWLRWRILLNRVKQLFNQSFATPFNYNIVGLLGHLKEGHDIIQYIMYEQNNYTSK